MPGMQGIQGPPGEPGENGTDGTPGRQGKQGLPGFDGEPVCCFVFLIILVQFCYQCNHLWYAGFEWN